LAPILYSPSAVASGTNFVANQPKLYSTLLASRLTNSASPYKLGQNIHCWISYASKFLGIGGANSLAVIESAQR
jgi:hypothetical protein